MLSAHRLQILDVEDLINQAIDAYKNGEVEHREAVRELKHFRIFSCRSILVCLLTVEACVSRPFIYVPIVDCNVIISHTTESITNNY